MRLVGSSHPILREMIWKLEHGHGAILILLPGRVPRVYTSNFPQQTERGLVGSTTRLRVRGVTK